MAASKPPSVLGIFYGFPPELIAQWCGVSVKTAELYKAGARKPSRQALRLFALFRDGRVLDQNWRGWHITKDAITDPDGRSTTRNQLHGYAEILQWVAAVSSRDERTREQYYDLLKQA